MKRLTLTAKEMIIGILLYGALLQIIAWIFISDKIHYTIGLWSGILLSVVLVIQMNHTIGQALDQEQKGARNTMLRGYGFRMLLVVLVFAVLFKGNFGSIYAAAAALLSIKIGAYLQPLIDRLIGAKLQ